MLSGVKIIPRDKVHDENSGGKRKKSGSAKDKRKKKTSGYSSSDDGTEKITKRSSRKKKWYSSDEYSVSDSGGSESAGEDNSDFYERKKHRNKKKCIGIKKDGSEDDRTKKRPRKESRKISKRSGKNIDQDSPSDDSRGSPSAADGEIVRREMGLEWMLRPGQKTDTKPTLTVENKDETPVEEVMKVNPKELNPYLKDNGTGYPEEGDEKKDQLLSTSLVGDGGASWRVKALKRAKEQAAREGRRFEEVVEERWGSFGKLAVSAASLTAASSRAHLHAIRNRRKEPDDEHQTGPVNKKERHFGKGSGRDYLGDVSRHHPEMKAPKTDASLSWGKRKSQTRANEDVGLISEAASSLNKFTNDGNFMQDVLSKQKMEPVASFGSHMNAKSYVVQKALSSEADKPDEWSVVVEGLSANQLAAKALQLRMKGKHDEAQKLMEEAEKMKVKQATGDNCSSRQHDVITTTRYAIQDVSARRRGDDDKTDRHLARTIMQNKQFSVSGQADDEYDYGDAPCRKSRKKGSSNDGQIKISERDNRVKHILTQQERCLFCFENPSRPKHLIVSIANFTYLMLPQFQPVVPGHCYIVPMQHEAATRSIDDNVWEEIRNFKKCLIMMFAKQEKEVVFLETVMGLSQQRRHCLIECVPLPQEIAKEAPLYFKKAIDEAEDEWSQHNAKKLIDTSVKGLRSSIPKNFPYFHVEFGLNRGFVHVIDDEKQFKSSLGMNVIRGMLQLPEEDMYRRRRHEPVESQKQGVASFAREWEPFDWTKQLD